jgi:hypothetical protein
MKTRGSWVKVLGVASTTVLACGLWLLATSRGSGRRGQEATSRASGTKQNSRWTEAYGKLPLSFEENVGQTAPQVRYVSNGAGFKLFLTPQEAVLALRSPFSHDLSPLHRFAAVRALREALRAQRRSTIRMRFEGANPAARISATGRLLKRTNYFIGNDTKKWRTDVPSYARVKYEGIYPGVDLVFYGNQRRLEYDFIVAPGADPRAIRLKLQGARKLRINARGDVVLSLASGEVVLQKPVVYQMVKGERHEIAGGYVLGKGQHVTFSVPAYDRNEPLILDPVLNYSTYLGGGSDDGFPAGMGIAVDATGNAFVAGTTFSNDFPTTTSGFDPGPPASGATFGAVFVTELNPTGTAELYSTYLAGSNGEIGAALDLDPTGKIYVTGLTFSSDFPTTPNALKQSPNPTNDGIGTSFLSKIDPAISGANSLVYSSYIGGTEGAAFLSDFGNAIAVDASGNAYLTGITFSSPGTGLTNFPVLNAFQATPNDITDGNAFLTRIDTTKSGTASLIYSTYLGGTGTNATNLGSLGFADAGFGVAVDSSNNAYIIGATSSTDFPTLNGFQTTAPVGNTKDTAFVTRLDTTKSGNASLIYSTYLGGEVFDFGSGIGLGPSNVAYVTGSTNSLLFPTTAGAFQTTGNAAGVAFVSLVDTSKTGAASLQYSTFLGGTNVTSGIGIRADGAGNAYVVGSTSAADFPVTSGAFLTVRPGPAAQSDGFLTKVNPAGGGAADLVYSTFFGGNGTGHDQVFAVALDAANPANAFITGQTFSSATSFPIFPAGAFQTTLKGTSDAFLAKLTLIPTLAVTPMSLNFGIQPVGVASSAKTVTLTNNTSDAIPFPGTTVTFSGTNAADFSSPSNTCGASIAAGASCTVSAVFTPSVTAAESATMVITVVITNGGISSSQAFNVSLSGTGSASAPGAGLAPATLDFGGQMLTTTSAAKTVTLTNNGNATLTITSITASGDFTVSNNPCGASLAAGANCIISVTFAPTVLGARVGTLTITDNAGSGTQTVPLTGTGWDFTITGPGAQTVSAAAPLHFNVTMTPQGGFNQAVALTCTGAPTGTTCTVVTPVTAADGVTAQTAQVTVTTTAMMLPPPSTRIPPMSIRQVVPLVLAMMLLFLLPRTKRLRLRVGMVAAMLMLVLLAGCSGPGQPVKPPVNATLTITGSSTGTAGAVSHTAQVALTIN